jgi:quercetin dioxygenase-like cupin family protein
MKRHWLLILALALAVSVFSTLTTLTAQQQTTTQSEQPQAHSGEHKTKGHMAGKHRAMGQGRIKTVTFTPDKIQWTSGPRSLPQGAQVVALEGNPMNPGAFTIRLKMPDGYRIPPHHHPKPEHVTVLSGTFRVGMGETWDDSKLSDFGEGSFAVIEPGMRHFATASGETVIQLHGVGPWQIVYVNPSDDPRRQATAER